MGTGRGVPAPPTEAGEGLVSGNGSKEFVPEQVMLKLIKGV